MANMTSNHARRSSGVFETFSWKSIRIKSLPPVRYSILRMRYRPTIFVIRL